MSNTNSALASAPTGEFNATLDIRIPGSLVKKWDIPAETLPVQSTIDEILAWIKAHIIKCLTEDSYIDVQDFEGFMQRLSEDVKDPSICFATAFIPVIDGKERDRVNLDDEHAKRFNTVRDLFIDPAQLGGSARLEFKVVLKICTQPPGVSPATDANTLDNFVHPRRQNAKYIRVGTIQENKVQHFGMQETEPIIATKAAHINTILARFYPLQPLEFSGVFHVVPIWQFDNFFGGIGDPDASEGWTFRELKLIGKTNLWSRFEEARPGNLIHYSRTAINQERRDQSQLTTVQQWNGRGIEAKKRHPPERPFMTFKRPDLSSLGNQTGVSFPGTASLQAVVQVIYHFKGAPLDQNHCPRNMQLPVTGTMSVQDLETDLSIAGRSNGDEEDQIIAKYRNMQVTLKGPFCEWWVMPWPRGSRLLYRVEDKSVHVALYIENAASATGNKLLYMECHIWDSTEMAWEGL